MSTGIHGDKGDRPTWIPQEIPEILRANTASIDSIGRILDTHNRTFELQSELIDGHRKRLDAMFFTILGLAIVAFGEAVALIALAVSS